MLHSKCVGCVLWCLPSDLVFACLCLSVSEEDKNIQGLSDLGIFEKCRVSVLVEWYLYIRCDNHRTQIYSFYGGLN